RRPKTSGRTGKSCSLRVKQCFQRNLQSSSIKSNTRRRDRGDVTGKGKYSFGLRRTSGFKGTFTDFLPGFPSSYLAAGTGCKAYCLVDAHAEFAYPLIQLAGCVREDIVPGN